MTSMLAENLGRAWTDRLNAARRESLQALAAPGFFTPERMAQLGLDVDRSGRMVRYFGRQVAAEVALADPFFADEVPSS